MVLLVRPQQRDVLQAEGFRIRGHTELHGHLPCITDPAEATGTFDAVVLTCKAHATTALAPQVAPLLGAHGSFVTLQNGFGNAEKMARFVPPDRIAVALTSHGVTMEAPGRLWHAGTGPTRVGPFPGAAGDHAARRAYALMLDAGLEPEWSDDVRPHVWLKGLVNHAVNPVAALAGVANGRLLAGRLGERCRILAEEGHALSRAAGVALPADVVATVRSTLERTAENRCSMLQDVAARRPTEVEQITGHLVRLARRLGYPMVASEGVYRDLKRLESSYLGEAASLRMAREEAKAESAVADGRR